MMEEHCTLRTVHLVLVIDEMLEDKGKEFYQGCLLVV